MTVLAKKIICLLLVPVICIGAFSGCSGGSADVPEMTLSDYVPKREGDEDTFTAQLYFVSDDGLHLSIEEREVRCGKGMSRAEAAIGAHRRPCNYRAEPVGAGRYAAPACRDLI